MFSDCPSRCPPTCGDSPDMVCTADCAEPGCVCNEGFVRSEPGGVCIRPEDCGKLFKCPLLLFVERIKKKIHDCSVRVFPKLGEVLVDFSVRKLPGVCQTVVENIMKNQYQSYVSKDM